jgi:hypothetical protein
MPCLSIENDARSDEECEAYRTSAAGRPHYCSHTLDQPGTICKCVDNLVVSQLLDSSQTISTSFIQVVLDLVNNPLFDKSALTLRTFSDVFAFRASTQFNVASKRSRLANSIRNFPPVILDNIVDIIENERVQPVSLEGYFIGQPNEFQSNEYLVMSTLANMSLVHPSWTWPAQKAMGREIRIVCEVQYALEMTRRAVSSVRYGPWTRRVFVNYTPGPKPRRRDRRRRENIYSNEEQDRELSRLLTELLKRAPNLRQVSLSWSRPIFNIAANSEVCTTVFDQLATLKQVGFLSLSGIIPLQNIAVTKSMVRAISELQNLKVFSLAVQSNRHWNDWLSDVQGAFGETPHSAVTKGLQASRYIQMLCFELNDLLTLPLLEWIVGSPQLRHLKLHLGSSDTKIQDTLQAVAANSSAFTMLHTLEIAWNAFHLDFSQEATMFSEIIRRCVSLRSVRLDAYDPLIIRALLDSLPETVTQFHCKFQHPFQDSMEPSIEAFDTTLSCWINSASFQSTSLAQIGLHLHCCVFTRWDVNDYVFTPETPNPVLSQTTAACERESVRLHVEWERISIPIAPQQPVSPPLPGGALEAAGAPPSDAAEVGTAHTLLNEETVMQEQETSGSVESPDQTNALEQEPPEFGHATEVVLPQ